MTAATLRNASIEFAFKGSFLVGDVYDDPTGTFEDGRRIFTSWIDEQIDSHTFRCRSGNFYRVESWRYPVQDDPGDVTSTY